MKKLLLLASLALIGSQAYGAVLSTNITSSHAQALLGNVYLLSTNRASIHSIQFSSAYPGTIAFYDNNSLANGGTNYAITSSWITYGTFATNYVTTYVGNTGFTNWYTNAGFWTYSITNAAATNALTPSSVFAFSANTYATYNVDLLHSKGIVVLPTTNVSVIINYRSGQ